MADEPAIVVEHRKELSYLLCQAAEIEHMAMCQYLFAAFSLRSAPGPGLTPEQLEAVERWRSVVLRIADEEMLHWALVNNLLTAIGSAPFVSRPHLPHRARGYPPTVQFALLGFGETALRHFIYFERPRDIELTDAPEFAPVGDAPAPMQATELPPRPQDFVTQGQLYAGLEDGLRHLVTELGKDGLFIGPPWAQAGPEAFRWPELEPVTDLEAALRVLQRIVEQGEGATGDWKTAHYGRFLDVLDEYLAMRADDPAFEPAHPVASAVVRGVDGNEPAGPVITDAVTAAVSDLFDVVYDLILQVVCRYFAFGHETPDQHAMLAQAAVMLMVGAIKPLGLLLATLPVGDAMPRATAGAPFQLSYRSNFLLPHRRVAWIRFAERLDEAATFAAGIEAADPETTRVLEGVVKTLHHALTRLSSEIEPV